MHDKDLLMNTTVCCEKYEKTSTHRTILFSHLESIFSITSYFFFTSSVLHVYQVSCLKIHKKTTNKQTNKNKKQKQKTNKKISDIRIVFSYCVQSQAGRIENHFPFSKQIEKIIVYESNIKDVKQLTFQDDSHIKPFIICFE